MARLPTLKQKPFINSQTFLEIVGVGPPLIAAAVTAVWTFRTAANNDDKIKGSVLAAGVVWLGVHSFLKVRAAALKDKEAKERDEPKDFQAAALVLCRCVRRVAGLDDTDDSIVRVTIHRVEEAKDGVPESGHIEQMVPYAGGKGGLPGRKFPLRPGIIGRAYRERKPFVMSRDPATYKEYQDELVSKWGYNRREATLLTQDRQAWMAVPILSDPGDGSDEKVIGIVYLDSNKADFFAADIVDVVISACGGIKKHIDGTYK